MSISKSAVPARTPQATRVMVEHARLAYIRGIIPFAVIFQCACALVIPFFSMHMPSIGMMLWSVAIIAIAMVHFGLFHRFPTRQSEKALKRIKKRFLQYTFALAGMWAIFPLLALPGSDPIHQAVIGLVLMSVLGAGSFTRAASLTASLGWIAIISLGAFISIWACAFDRPLLLVTFLTFYSGVSALLSWKISSILCHRFQNEAELVRRNDFIEVMLNEYEHSVSDWIWETNAGHFIIHASPRLLRVTGMSERALGRASALQHLEGAQGIEAIETLVQARRPFKRLIICIDAHSSRRWWEISGKPYFDDRGEFLGYRGVGSDITQRQRAHLGMTYLAEHDSLTKLRNRAWFQQHLHVTIEKPRTSQGVPVLFMLDIDNFKPLNDQWGHAFGDSFLIAFSELLKILCTPENICASRQGGDEFALLGIFKSEAAALDFADRLLKRFDIPLNIQQKEVQARFSIGLTLHAGATINVQKLMQQADLALYEAKRRGGHCAVPYYHQLDLAARERRQLITDLRQAINDKGMELYFQPIVMTGSHQPTHFEALLRWNNPTRGFIGPDVFIPLAEETGLIHALGNWVIDQACAVLSRLPAEYGVAVNLSPHQLKTDDVLHTVETALATHGLAPSRLTLEVTESALMHNADKATRLLGHFHQRGIRLAMDDFGTGYSSLAYLDQFPFDILKVDRSFIKRLGGGDNVKDSTPIVETIMVLARQLGLDVIAEGVETRQQAETLHAMDCTFLQGYYLGRPTPLSTLMENCARVT
ncbi:putative bifunctional diguanylate cyclase/phosphodiesterase [Larsenimonas rhizosphaerae]|uniref:EAL domain-containing protein n=1 Tax=Larsenimonas rhizosphaerae TaxID=2944682 RepID=A0AA41ZKT0_9GAMM|nr:EAL domain-containing protein [Larsenimonas rhizosphaerae]MCX2523588.1 EAL domain-containing protein [Larsenimonas rhizosphaerae]